MWTGPVLPACRLKTSTVWPETLTILPRKTTSGPLRFVAANQTRSERLFFQGRRGAGPILKDGNDALHLRLTAFVATNTIGTRNLPLHCTFTFPQTPITEKHLILTGKNPASPRCCTIIRVYTFSYSSQTVNGTLHCQQIPGGLVLS